MLQIERVRQRILAAFPGLRVEVLPVDTRGDQLQDIPLQTVEGTDFFTAELRRMLEQQEADIAVHSLKDLSAAHFFSTHRFAVTEREDVRDIALFRPDVMDKIKRGETLVIGTCSPRREDMALDFLRKALPRFDQPVSLTVRPIRGNVDTRLRKLDEGQYDGTILATAGLNRLLEDAEAGPMVRALLAGKRRMLLPIVECVPAPCQGAIVAEAAPGNARALTMLNAINQPELYRQCVAEKAAAMRYGTGCDQRFGVTHVAAGDQHWLYAAGRDGRGREIAYWSGLPSHAVSASALFSSTDRMGDFFGYTYAEAVPLPDSPVVYIASHAHVRSLPLPGYLEGRTVWAAGTRTWYALAARGVWVDGSADALGLETLRAIFAMPVVQVNPEDVTVFTHSDAVDGWRRKGWKAIATCGLLPQPDDGIAAAVQSAQFHFWTSFGQYTQYGQLARPGAVHACPYGETAEKLRAAGVEPLIFPTIKSFQAWRQSITR